MGRHMKTEGAHGAASSKSARKPRFKQTAVSPVTPQKHVSQKKSGRAKKTIVTIVILALLGTGAYIAKPFFQGFFAASQTVSTGVDVEVSFANGSNAGQFADQLYQKGLVSSTSEFIDEVKAQEAGAKLKPGVYMIKGGTSVSEIVKMLTMGPEAFGIKLSIPEGYTVDKIAKRAQEVYGINPEDFKAQAKASKFAGEFSFLQEAHDDSLEGFLYPKTYTFPGNKPTAEDVIRAMLSQYQKEVAGLDFTSAQARIKADYGVEMTPYKFLTLASIIEREATTPEQQGLVSSVFYNRFKEGMPLQSDATMMYVTGGEVTAADLKIESPYNTYLNSGLTPTPICSPSMGSIKAALNPDSTKYLYFFINEKVTQFSETFEEHNQAIERARG